jgi:hypothetical protein
MNSIHFDTKNAQFQFNRKDVEARLEILKAEYAFDEAETILKRISIPKYESKLIQMEHEYFGYLVLELIGVGKGSITCKSCNKTYKTTQLRSIAVGHGYSPFDVNPEAKKGIKSLFQVLLTYYF